MNKSVAHLTFDDIYLGYSDDFGGSCLTSAADVIAARALEAAPLLISNEVELFCTLVVMHGMLPSNAYLQAFTKAVDGQVIKPDLPSHYARKLVGTLEVKARIQELRDEVSAWGRTTFEEVEMNLRSIALNPMTKDSDRIAASKSLAALRNFGAQEGGMVGGTIVINLPFAPRDLTPGRTIEQSVLDSGVSS